MIDQAVKDAVSRARLELAEWREEDGRILVIAGSAKPIDDRMIRYLDRSSVFENARIDGKSADGTSSS